MRVHISLLKHMVAGLKPFGKGYDCIIPPDAYLRQRNSIHVLTLGYNLGLFPKTHS